MCVRGVGNIAKGRCIPAIDDLFDGLSNLLRWDDLSPRVWTSEILEHYVPHQNPDPDGELVAPQICPHC